MSKSVEDILKETEKIGDFLEKELGTKRYNEILEKMGSPTGSQNCDWCDHLLEIHTHDMKSEIYRGNHLGCQQEFCNCTHEVKK